MVSDNIPSSRHHGAAKQGDALLAGLLRCRRCGRKLTLRYSGTKHNIPRYTCNRGWLDHAEPRCMHGAPVSNRAELKEFRDMLVAIRENVRALKKQGRSRDETVAAKPTAAFDAKWGNFVIDPGFFTRLVYETV